MILVLSPTKIQRHTPRETSTSTPLFFEKSQQILNTLKHFSVSDIMMRYKVSEKLASSTYDTFQNPTTPSPAIYTYYGEAFKTLNVDTLKSEEILYAQEHMRIFSSLYGILKPLDIIQKYRLDFKTHFDFNLVAYWSPLVTKELSDLNQVIVNLASSEYSQLLDHKNLQCPLVTIHFMTQNGTSEPRIIGSHAKKARGLFARAFLLKKPKTLEELKSIQITGYRLDPSRTDTHSITYIRKELK